MITNYAILSPTRLISFVEIELEHWSIRQLATHFWLIHLIYHVIHWAIVGTINQRMIYHLMKWLLKCCLIAPHVTTPYYQLLVFYNPALLGKHRLRPINFDSINFNLNNHCHSPCVLIFSCRQFSFLYSSTVVKTKNYIVHYLECFLQKRSSVTDIGNYILDSTQSEVSTTSSI